MAKKGRPSLFSETHQKIAFAMAKLGATDKQIAVELGITEQTFNNWKKDYPDFFESLKTAKQEPDEKVERSLFERATGYSCPEDKIFNDNGNAMIVPTIKYYPPDVTACIFWLKNRKPAEWLDKQEIQHSGGISVNLAPLDETL